MQALAEIEPLKSLRLEEVPRTQALYAALMKAHYDSAFRENISTVTMLNTTIGSSNYANGIAAACLAIGGPHAPLQQSMALLASDDPVGQAKQLMDHGVRVPGWGNSFIKGKPDGAWLEVDRLLSEDHPEIYSKIADVTKFLHKSGKLIFPNPSIYTAAVAIVLNLPPALSPYLFIAGRLNAWTELAGRHLA